jgi:hypothetical protein
LQRRAAVARWAHNSQVAGSIPAGATGFSWERKGLAVMQGFFYLVRMFSYDLKNFKLDKGFLIIVICFGIIVAPLWFIFQFLPEIFKNYDLIKLLFLSLAIGFPITFTNFCFGSLTYFCHKRARQITTTRKAEEEDMYLMMYGAASLNIFIFYAPCINSYFTKMTTREAIRMSAILGCSFFALTCIAFVIAKYEEEKSKKPKTLA